MKVVILKTKEIKEVAAGYARNFLFPKKWAVPATPNLIAQIQQAKEAEEKRKKEAQAKEKEMLEKIKDKKFTVLAKATASASLYAYLPVKQIVQAMGIPEEWLKLEEPIKKLGEYEIKIITPHGLSCQVKILVNKC